MNTATIDHCLSCISIADDSVVVDLSLDTDKTNDIYSKIKNISIYDTSLNGKVDFVLYLFSNETTENFESIVLKAKELLKLEGKALFAISVAGNIESWSIASFFQCNDLKILETSCDKIGDKKDHVFLVESIAQKENQVPIFTPKSACTKATVNCPVPKNSAMPDCCASHLNEMLDFLTNLLDSNSIPYWLDGGTLLGAARNGKIIPWDTNANIGIFEPDEAKVKALYKYFTIEGYYLEGKRRTMHLNYSRKNDLFVKIYSYRLNKTQMICNDLSFDKKYVQSFSEITLNNKNYKCPSDVEKFLCDQYGANWKIPSNSFGKTS